MIKKKTKDCMTSYVDAIFVKPNVLALQMKNPKQITARQSNHSNY